MRKYSLLDERTGRRRWIGLREGSENSVTTVTSVSDQEVRNIHGLLCVTLHRSPQEAAQEASPHGRAHD